MTGAPATQQIDGKEVLEKIQELLSYGHGRLEVVVRDHEIITLYWGKSKVKPAKNK